MKMVRFLKSLRKVILSITLLIVYLPLGNMARLVGIAYPATFTVTNTNDSGAGSLRQAILDANNSAGKDTIAFDIPGVGPHTMQPISALPIITDPVVLDATTEPDFAGNPIIELDGSNAGVGVTGLTIRAGESTVRGMVINRFGGSGIKLEITGSNVIEGNFIGTDVNGTSALGNSDHGIVIERSALNVIGGTESASRNIISGNSGRGIVIFGSEATGNQVLGNFIGVDITGTVALGNRSGVEIVSGPINTNVARNIISGNNQGSGVVISGSMDNKVLGNLIGTDVTGMVALSNLVGVLIIGSAPNNTIGGITAEDRNIISGNISDGVRIDDVSQIGGIVVQGNFIGTDVTGALALGNGGDGVVIIGGEEITIGGTTAGAGNLISGNTHNNISIEEFSAGNNLVQGNFIGTDVTGTVALSDSAIGVLINDSPQNIIGGIVPGAGNLISGNKVGIWIQGASFGQENIVQGNRIGTDVSGTSKLGNSTCGVVIENAGKANIIGGTDEAARNIISGNKSHGILLIAERNQVQGNFIGVDITGKNPLGNGGDGVRVSRLGGGNKIGGEENGARNIISGNGRSGIHIFGSHTGGTTVQGNFVGTDVTGALSIGNSEHGVVIDNSPLNGIAGNLISGNKGTGIKIMGSDATNNRLGSNVIGTQVDSTSPLGNTSHGVHIVASASNNEIGSDFAQFGNIIAFNGGNGVTVGSGTGNNIKINSSFSNQGLGIDLGEDGVTPNDSADADVGPNNLQNFPAITILEINESGELLIEYGLDSDLNYSRYPLIIDFYESDSSGEGKTFLKSDAYTAADFTNGTKIINLGNIEELGIISSDFIVATATDNDGNTSEFSPIDTVGTITSVAEITYTEPRFYSLSQNYPNPFNPETTIPYQLPKPSHVNLSIYNILGQPTITLVDKEQSTGFYSVRWDGTDDRGRKVASGVYLYRLKTKEFSHVKRLVLLR